MTSNIRMLIQNDWDDSTLTLATGTPVATLPLTNTQSYNNARSFRTTTLSGVVVDGDFPSGSYVSGFVMYRHNLTADATYRFRLYSGAAQTGSTVYDSGTLAALDSEGLGEFEWGVDPLSPTMYDDWDFGVTVLWMDSVYSAASFKLDISDASNGDSYIDITRCYLGRVFEPSSNFNWGASNVWTDDVEQIRTAGGSVYTADRTAFRQISCQLNWLSGVDRALFFDQTRTVGKHKDIFISLYPESSGAFERDYQFAAKFTQPPNITRPLVNYYSTGISVREV